MKRYINGAIAYAILGMAGGVFYREFTRNFNYTGKTTLSFVHTHYLVLGMVFFLLLLLLQKNNLLPANNRKSLLVYQVGLNLTCCMLLVRGVVQVLGMVPSAAMQGSISGIAGIGHCLLGVGLVWILVGIRSSIAAAESTDKADHQTV